MNKEQKKQAADNFIEAINKGLIAQGYKALDAGEEDLVYNAFINGAEWADKNQPNPWISVKDRLPKIGDVVLTKIENIVKCGEEYEKTEHPLVQVYNGRWGTDRCEQHRMGGRLYDCISRVTNWMQIPELEGGES